MKNKRFVGRYGEDVVTEFLQKSGYTILDKNFRCRLGEIDIIAKEMDTIAFIEVKTRKNLAFGYPSESVTQSKQMRIRRVAQYYILKYGLSNKLFRFDVVEVYINSNNTVEKINVIKNAF